MKEKKPNKANKKKKAERLTGRQIQALEFLSMFLYLTPSQFFRLGIDKNRGNFQSLVTNYLQEKGFIDHIVPTEQGEYENIYYLTEAGGLELSRLKELPFAYMKIPSKKAYGWGSTYYWHNKYTIDCYIECYLNSNEVGITILEYDLEVEKNAGGGRTKLTSIAIGNARLDPDAIFKIATEKGDKLYAFEMERRDNRSLYQLDEKIWKHVEALNSKAISPYYNHLKGHRILFVCEHEATRDYIINFLKDRVENSLNWFLFKTLDEVVPRKSEEIPAVVENGIVIAKKKKGPVLFSDNPLYWKNDPNAESKAQAEQRNFFENWLAINGQRVPMF